jgi:hypothetical protein
MDPTTIALALEAGVQVMQLIQQAIADGQPSVTVNIADLQASVAARQTALAQLDADIAARKAYDAGSPDKSTGG